MLQYFHQHPRSPYGNYIIAWCCASYLLTGGEISPFDRSFFERETQAVINIVRTNPGIGLAGIKELVDLNWEQLLKTIDSLISDGIIEERKKGERRRFYII